MANLKELPGPAPYYVSVAMANSDQQSGKQSWPISGDHSVRSKQARAAIPLSDYIHLATQRNVC